MKEKPVLFGTHRTLIGIATEPKGRIDRRRPAVIILNAGFVHRVGPNRIYVKLARDLASVGFHVLRFDFSGIGDSPSRRDTVPLEDSAIYETQQAMDYVKSTAGIDRFILTGICSGANVAVKTASADERVVGIAAINGTCLDNIQSHHLSRHIEDRMRQRYYRKHVGDPSRWWKLVTGRSDLRTAGRFFAGKMRRIVRHKVSEPPLIDASTECTSLVKRGVNVLLIYSEGSTAWDAFRLTLEAGMAPIRSGDRLKIEMLENVDHVFTLGWSQAVLIDLIRQWACDKWQAGATTGSPDEPSRPAVPTVERERPVSGEDQRSLESRSAHE